MNIYYFTPFSLNKNLGAAYNEYMSLLSSNDDWVCFTDADTMFLTSDYGRQIHQIVNMYPDTGMFTCYTNRLGNKSQRWMGSQSTNSDICYHRKLALDIQRKNTFKVRELDHFISGHLMLLQRRTWLRVGGFKDGLLSVDNHMSKKILDSGRKILLMEGIYIFHYYRLIEGRKNKDHLL